MVHGEDRAAVIQRAFDRIDASYGQRPTAVSAAVVWGSGAQLADVASTPSVAAVEPAPADAAARADAHAGHAAAGQAALQTELQGLGYACLNDAVSGPDGSAPERDAYSDTVLAGRLRAALGPDGLPVAYEAVVAAQSLLQAVRSRAMPFGIGAVIPST